MEQCGSWMVPGHPCSVSSGDLVIYPGERASGRPVHQGSGLPAEPEPPVFALVRLRRLRPGHHRQVRQPDPGRYLGVRILLPGRGPHQGARQRGQATPGIRTEPCQVRDGDRPPRPGLRVSAEGKQRPVDVEEEQGATRMIGHGRTIALRRHLRRAAVYRLWLRPRRTVRIWARTPCWRQTTAWSAADECVGVAGYYLRCD
jgi:hypothetical protein